MEVKKTKKTTEPSVKLSDKYLSPEAIYSEKESQYQLFGKWKAKMDEIVKKTNQILRLKLIAAEGKKMKKHFRFYQDPF